MTSSIQSLSSLRSLNIESVFFFFIQQKLRAGEFAPIFQFCWKHPIFKHIVNSGKTSDCVWRPVLATIAAQVSNRLWRDPSQSSPLRWAFVLQNSCCGNPQPPVCSRCFCFCHRYYLILYFSVEKSTHFRCQSINNIYSVND